MRPHAFSLSLLRWSVPAGCLEALAACSSSTEPVPVEPIEQYAVSAVASSEYTDATWSAMQATGAPDVTQCGDIPQAWASERSGTEEWIELTYAERVRPTEVRIHESFNPGSVVRVDVKLASGQLQAVYTAAPAIIEECPRTLTVPITGVQDKILTVRLSVDQRLVGNWSEIDAVQLKGTP
jgi:hypothetical protein